jgi:hypothetical protein
MYGHENVTNIRFTIYTDKYHHNYMQGDYEMTTVKPSTKKSYD